MFQKRKENLEKLEMRVKNIFEERYEECLRDEAIELLNQTLVISREIRNRKGEGSRLGELTNTYFSPELYVKAIESLNQALGARIEWRYRGYNLSIVSTCVSFNI